MREFNINVLLFFLLLSGIAFINYKQDPHGKLRGSGEEKILAERLNEGENTIVQRSINLRVLRKIQMQQRNEPRNLAIIGGSTALEISELMFDSVSLHNYAVIEASIEDYEGLYGMYSKNKPGCDQLLFDISAYSFLEESGAQHRWLSISEEYLDALRGLGSYSLSEEFRTKMVLLRTLVSVPTFRKSVSQFISEKPSRSSAASIMTTIFADGSWNRLSVVDSLNKLRSVTVESDPGFDPPGTIVREKVQRFKVLMEHAKAQEQKVWLMLSPYSPSLYRQVIAHSSGIIDLEKELILFAQKHQIELVGSFNPEKLNLEEEDFIDPVHWHPNSKTRYFDSIHLSDSFRGH